MEECDVCGESGEDECDGWVYDSVCHWKNIFLHLQLCVFLCGKYMPDWTETDSLGYVGSSRLMLRLNGISREC